MTKLQKPPQYCTPMTLQTLKTLNRTHLPQESIKKRSTNKIQKAERQKRGEKAKGKLHLRVLKKELFQRKRFSPFQKSCTQGQTRIKKIPLN